MNKSWKVGLERIGPGVYVDNRTHALHIDEQEMCAAQGKPYTEANALILREAIDEALREQYRDVKVTVEDNT